MRYRTGTCPSCGKYYDNLPGGKPERSYRCRKCGAAIDETTEWLLLPVYSLDQLGEVLGGDSTVDDSFHLRRS